LTRASFNRGEPRWYTIHYSTLNVLVAKAIQTSNTPDQTNEDKMM
jgi:hypothetical protein